jgi:hypothetical protein
MTVRYIFNTNGQYVAFIQGDNLFSPDAEWIGFLRNGTHVFSKDGTFMGQLLNDDRIARNSSVSLLSIIPPLPPFPPFRPIAPFPRLRKSSLPGGWKDAFEDGPPGSSNRLDQSALQQLLGSQLIAGDGVFLGVVSKNRMDSNSLGNSFGSFGNRYSATSIFNPYSQYGNKYSVYSPFNKYSTTPPVFIKNGRELGKLTVNTNISQRIDPEKFFQWFESV